MKKLLLTLLGALIALQATAFDYTYGGVTLTYTVTDATNRYCSVAKKGTSYTSLPIPLTIDNNGTVYTVTSIASDGFKGCTLPATVALPPSITKIGSGAFSGCSALKTLYMGPKVAEIGSQAFSGVSLTALYITSQTPPALSTDAFNNKVTKLYVQGTTAKSQYDADTSWKAAASTITTTTDLTSIYVGRTSTPSILNSNGQGAKSAVMALSLGKEVKYQTKINGISDSGIGELYWSSSKPNIAFVDKDGTVTLKSAPDSKNPPVITLQTLYNNGMVINFTVKAIDFSANTAEGKELNYIILNDTECSVASPADLSLSGTISIPASAKNTATGKSYNVIQIENNAFEGCTSVSEVKMADNVTIILPFAFSGCKAMTKITYSNNLKQLGQLSFCDCKALESIEIPNSVTAIGSNVFQGCSALTKAILPNTLTSIVGGLFTSCTNLASIDIPTTVTSIGYGAFSSCKSLKEVVVPPNVETLSTNAFKGCTSLKTIYLGPKIKNLVNGSLSGLTSLESLYITAQTAPTLEDGVFGFGETKPRLYLQGTSTTGYDAAPWTTLFQADTQMSEPSLMKAGRGSTRSALGYSNQSAASSSIPLNINSSIQYGAALSGVASTGIPKVFWSSSNPSVAYVTQDGIVTLKSAPDAKNPPVIRLETLYNNGPVINFTVKAIDFAANTVEGKELNYIILDDKNCAVACPSDLTISGTITIPLTATNPADKKNYKVTRIEHSALGGCSDLTEVIMSDNVTYIGNTAFSNCTMLAKITFSESLVEIGNKAFCDCPKLTSVVLPNSLTTIKGNAFQSCSGLISVVLPNTLTELVGGLFTSCTNLASIDIPTTVTSIGYGAFSSCKSLKEVVVPPNVETLSTNAFKGCTSLKTIYLGPKIKNLVNGSLSGLTSLESLYITAQTAPTLEDGVFGFGETKPRLYLQGTSTTGYDAAPWTTLFQAATQMSEPSSMNAGREMSALGILNYPGQGAKSASMPLSIDVSSSFKAQLNNLSSAGIPKVFWSSSNPSVAYVTQDGIVTLKSAPDAKNPPIITLQTLYNDGMVINFTVKGIDFIAKNTEGNELNYIILNEDNCAVACPTDPCIAGVLSIPDTATDPDTKITYVVTRIEDNAFEGCNAITKVKMSDQVTVIRPYAFSKCSNMTEIKFSDNLTQIGRFAFANCSNLANLVVPNSVTTIGNNAFQSCSILKTATLPNTLTSIIDGLFTSCQALESIILPTSVKSIGYGSFSSCKALKEIVLPPNVETISTNAFKNCSGLTTIYMGPKVGKFVTGAFTGLTSLKEMYITAQTAPTLENDVFSFGETKPVLYVQNTGTEDAYAAWKNYFTKIEPMKYTHEHVRIKVSMPNGPAFASASNDKADYSTESHIYALAGDSFSRTASTVLKDSGEDAPIPHAFWTSSDPSKVYVDNTGAISVNTNIDLSKPVTLNLQTLYADGPTHSVVVENYTMTGVETTDGEAPGLKMNEPALIFTADGLPAGSSLSNLAPGIYIVKQGQLTVKITVR